MFVNNSRSTHGPVISERRGETGPLDTPEVLPHHDPNLN